MLERASACIELGSRRLLRASTFTVRSRRMLHSSFWNHGGGDLDLGAWWTSMLRCTTLTDLQYTPMNNNGQALASEAADGGVTTVSHVEADPLLDFLYPPKTLALMRRISCLAVERSEYTHTPPGTFSHNNRAYSSTASQRRNGTSAGSSYGNPQRGLIEEHTSVHQSRHDHERRGHATTFEARRDDSTPWSLGYTSSEELESLVAEFEALQHERPSQQRSGLLFKRTLDLRRWDLAERVFGHFLTIADPKNNTDMDVLWDRASLRPNLRSDAQSLLNHVEERINNSTTNSNLLRKLTTQFVFRSLGHQALTPRLEVPRLFSRLQVLGWVDATLFEKVLIKQLNLSHPLPDQDGPILGLYSLYRATQNFAPSQRLLTLLLSRACKYEAERGFQGEFASDIFVQDWRKAYDKLDIKAYAILMLAFARSGNAAKVQSYFADLQTAHPDKITLSFFWPLLTAHAQRAEVEQVQKYFSLISQEYGLVPDLRCWNILLHAYSKARDLEGALQVYEDMAAQAIKPDGFTLSPLMSLFAATGDVDAIEQLLTVAKEKGIPIAPPMVGSRVLAYIRNHEVEKAEQIARDATAGRKMSQTIDSFTGVWNHIVTAYALEREPKAAIRILNFMEEEGMRPNSMTYAALMQCLTNVQQTNIADRILQNVLRDKNLQALGFHYAIIIRGYTHEGKFEAAFDTYQDMLRRKIKPSVGVEAVMMKLRTAADEKQTRKFGLDMQTIRPFRTPDNKTILAELERGLSSTKVATKQPKIGTEDIPVDQAYTAAFAQYLIATYGPEQVKKLVETAFKGRTRDATSDTALGYPMRILHAFMTAYLQAGKHEEVERFWALAFENAQKMAPRTMLPVSLKSAARADQKQHTDATKSKPEEEQTTTTPLTRESQQSHYAPARRNMLSGTLSLYLESLDAQGRHEDARSTVTAVLAAGYTLTNKIWNLYIQMLVKSSDTETAFATCEEQLMPQWPGWKKNAAGPRPHVGAAKGKLKVDVNPVMLKPSALYPKNRTMTLLAAALRRLVTDERDQLSINGSKDSSVDSLRLLAPNTISALQMLLLEDDGSSKRFA